MPGRPQPAAQPGHPGLGRHAGRYERTSRRFDVSARDGTLHVVERATGARTAFSEGPEEFDLHPADAGGDRFVARSRDADPWTPVSFARLADQTPYLYLGGRVTPKADCAGLGGTTPQTPG
jgi:hypothetical protein